MRDLAKQNFSSRKPIYKSRLARILLVILVLVGIFYVARSQINFGSSGGSSITLQEAPRNLTPIAVDGVENITEGGVDLVSQNATFKDVKWGGEAKATATRSFGGGTYILSVNATLPDPKNTFYEVWLVGGGSVIPIDFMTGSKNSWNLNLRSGDKYSKYSGIWITLERTKDELPEEHILEGNF
jgi:hypothetical protein